MFRSICLATSVSSIFCERSLSRMFIASSVSCLPKFALRILLTVASSEAFTVPSAFIMHAIRTRRLILKSPAAVCLLLLCPSVLSSVSKSEPRANPISAPIGPPNAQPSPPPIHFAYFIAICQFLVQLCCCRSSRNVSAHASDGILQSPRGERLTLPTLGPSGRQLRLNC